MPALGRRSRTPPPGSRLNPLVGIAEDRDSFFPIPSFSGFVVSGLDSFHRSPLSLLIFRGTSALSPALSLPSSALSRQQSFSPTPPSSISSKPQLPEQQIGSFPDLRTDKPPFFVSLNTRLELKPHHPDFKQPFHLSLFRSR